MVRSRFLRNKRASENTSTREKRHEKTRTFVCAWSTSALVIDDVKNIVEAGGNLSDIQFPLDVRTPIETVTRSMPHAFEGFSLDYLQATADIYRAAYENVLTGTQALLVEREGILETLRDPETDHTGLAERLVVIDADISLGVAATGILEEQTRFLVQTRGRVEFIRGMHR